MSTIIKLMAGLSLFAASMAPAAAAPPAVAVATLTGPIPVTAQSGEPYRGTNEQPVAGPGLPIPALVPYGYIEEEYFVSGTVDGQPYETSLLVRKPKDPSKFSGLVALETVHAQGAIPFWGQRDVWLKGGHGWVAVGSQLIALEQYIKKSNPARYASLRIPEMPQQAAAPGTPPGNPLAGGAQSRISQAILTQVGALLKSNLANGPFAGMKVKYLLMGGSSQTGGTTLQYIQESHAKARMPNGKPIYDGYAPMEAFAHGPITGGDAAVMHVVGEGDFELFRSMTHNGDFGIRDDSDAPNDRFREYQIVASSHVPTRGLSDPRVLIPTLTMGAGGDEHLSQFPSAPIYRAAMTHLVDWVMKGVVPPRAARIEMNNGDIVRDEYGNAKGGIRSPYVDVPTARYIASAPDPDGNNRVRRMLGLQEPFTAEKLRQLYKTRDNYLQLFDAGIDKMVSAGWLLAEDAQVLKNDETKTPPF
jgi:Alpha/beta hydrolase domain